MTYTYQRKWKSCCSSKKCLKAAGEMQRILDCLKVFPQSKKHKKWLMPPFTGNQDEL